ncbi:hypothetical protein [Peribacillus asahii]
MLTKRYLYDLCKWEVVVLAERAKDDERIGIYDTVMEANKAMDNYLN